MSISVYTLVTESAGVDERLADLGRELDGLSRVLNAISRSPLQTIPAPAQQAASGLFQSLNSSLDDCHITVEKLEGELGELGKRRGVFAWTGRPGRQVRLMLKAKDIAAFRIQIQAHVHDMQLALSAINL